MKRLLFLAFFVFGTIFVIAQTDDQGLPNDPTVNDHANACYEGGSMEGKCDTQWEWEAGWYLIRYEYGIFTREEIPAIYDILLPPDVPPASRGGDGCYTRGDKVDNSESFILIGPLNTHPNILVYFLTTNCTGDTNLPPNSVFTDEYMCESLGGEVVWNFRDEGYNTPANWFICAF